MNQRKLTIVGVALVAALASKVNAEELPDARQHRGDSFSGRALDQGPKRVRAAPVNELPTRLERLRKVLGAAEASKAFQLDHLDGARKRWASQTPGAQSDARALDVNRLVERAREVAGRMRELGLIGSSEQLSAVSAGGEISIGGANDQSKLVSRIIRRRVTIRRLIAGVPVLGRAGEIDVWFDGKGEVQELEFDATALGDDGGARTKANPQRLQGMFRGAGFSQTPTAVDGSIALEGKNVRVADLQCGYLQEQPNAELRKGCLLYTVGDKVSQITSVLAPDE